MHVNRVTHVSGSTGNGCPYRRSAGRERNQKCPYMTEVHVYTEHTRDKMRHLKTMCVTEMDIISSSTITTKKISPFLISGHHILAGLHSFYTATSRLV